MQPSQLYGSTPSASEYERRCLAVAEYEAQCIEFVFQRHGVNARINERITIVNRQFFAFAIDIGGGKRGRVQDVVNVQREIANAFVVDGMSAGKKDDNCVFPTPNPPSPGGFFYPKNC